MPSDIKKILANLKIPKEYWKTSGLDNPQRKSISMLAKPAFIGLVKPNMDLIIIVSEKLYSSVKNIQGNKYIPHKNPFSLFFEIHNFFAKKRFHISTGSKEEIAKTAVIGDNVKIGKGSRIMENCVIGKNVKIGEYCIIQPNTEIGDYTEMGNNCIVGPNVSVGEDGFRVVKDLEGNNLRVRHTGKVILKDFVEIGSLSTINRGTFKDTVIRNYVKIDNNVHIGHNVEIKDNSVICASSCIGGSSEIGENCWMGIGSIIRDGIKIGRDVMIDLGAVVVKDIDDGTNVAGFYAKNKLAWMMKEKNDMRVYGY
jgi:UDP-3-O-[3-hydroxymyristoyl] glucosamine N-acyltransferase LpxD